MPDRILPMKGHCGLRALRELVPEKSDDEIIDVCKKFGYPYNETGGMTDVGLINAMTYCGVRFKSHIIPSGIRGFFMRISTLPFFYPKGTFVVIAGSHVEIYKDGGYYYGDRTEEYGTFEDIRLKCYFTKIQRILEVLDCSKETREESAKIFKRDILSRHPIEELRGSVDKAYICWDPYDWKQDAKRKIQGEMELFTKQYWSDKFQQAMLADIRKRVECPVKYRNGDSGADMSE